MANDVGRGIIAPESGDRISSNGVSEMRTIATGAANAILDVSAEVTTERDARAQALTQGGARVDGVQDGLSTTRQELGAEVEDRTEGDHELGRRIDVLEEGYRPVFGIADLGNGTGRVTTTGSSGGGWDVHDNGDGTISVTT